jgi:hypothetical protein
MIDVILKEHPAAQPAVQGPQDGELIRGHFEADYTRYYRHADLTWDTMLETYKNERTRAAWYGWQCCTRNTPPAAPVKEHVATEGGKRLIVVDQSFDDLMYWLDRCEDKGHLENCPDLVEPYSVFQYENYAHQPAAQPAVQEPLSDLQKDAANLLFALHDAWPYVHGNCTIESKRKAIQALIVKHGGFADLHPPTQPAVPDAITDDSESPEYRTGWNDCRVEMMEMMK